MRRFLQVILIGLLSFLPGMVMAQTTIDSTMRSNGRIYVVVAVILFIFLGIVAYLVRLDKKITRLEKEYKQDN